MKCLQFTVQCVWVYVYTDREHGTVKKHTFIQTVLGLWCMCRYTTFRVYNAHSHKNLDVRFLVYVSIILLSHTYRQRGWNSSVGRGKRVWHTSMLTCLVLKVQVFHLTPKFRLYHCHWYRTGSWNNDPLYDHVYLLTPGWSLYSSDTSCTALSVWLMGCPDEPAHLMGLMERASAWLTATHHNIESECKTKWDQTWL